MTYMPPKAYPMLYARGTHYEVGYLIGSTFKDRIYRFHHTSERIAKILPVLGYNKGKTIYESYLKVVQEEFPFYVRETQGIADGASMPFEEIFLFNISKEILGENFEEIISSGEVDDRERVNFLEHSRSQISSSEEKNISKELLGESRGTNNDSAALDGNSTKSMETFNPKTESVEPMQKFVELISTEPDESGCTTVFLNKPTKKIIAHNEDCDPAAVDCAYLLCIDITDPEFGDRREHFTGFSYPGALPGHAFYFNKHGGIFTMNSLYTSRPMIGKTPRYFLNRALLNAANIEDVLQVVKNKGYGSAYGFCVNYANLNEPEAMWSVEVAPGTESVVFVKKISEQTHSSEPGCFIHINQYKIADGHEIDEIPRKSSTARTVRLDEMKRPDSLDDIKNILGDTQNKEYPIYRKNSETDKIDTVCTAVFDMVNKTLEIYTDNIKGLTKPLVVLPLNV